MRKDNEDVSLSFFRITVAQNITAAPIDVVAAFQIYASAQENAYSDIMQLRIRLPDECCRFKQDGTSGTSRWASGLEALILFLRAVIESVSWSMSAMKPNQ